MVAAIERSEAFGPRFLDPLGASLENGPDLYFRVIRNIATSIKSCLSEGS